jgi:putative Ca2+/H+ antiporter (TMEM165/GDT1 family)
MGITEEAETDDFDEKLREIEMEMISEKSRKLSKGLPSQVDPDQEQLVGVNDKEPSTGSAIGIFCKALIFNESCKVITTILCTEMGDRSQVSAIALAANYPFWIVAFAGSLGHILALILAILFGRAVSSYTTEK